MARAKNGTTIKNLATVKAGAPKVKTIATTKMSASTPKSMGSTKMPNFAKGYSQKAQAYAKLVGSK